MFEKVTRLGGKPPKKQLAPMNIRIGITEKQKARETKRQAQVCYPKNIVPYVNLSLNQIQI